MSSASRKRQGSDGFIRPPGNDKRSKPANSKDASDNYISPKSPQTGNYGDPANMPPPDALSAFRNGPSNRRTSPNSAISPIKTNVARSGSGNSTPVQGRAPVAPMTHTMTVSASAKNEVLGSPGTILEQLQDLASSANSVALARGNLDKAKMELFLDTLQVGSKSHEKHKWTKDVGEMADSNLDPAVRVKEREAELEEALAAQNTATRALAALLSTIAPGPGNDNLTPSVKQLLEQKDRDLQQLQSQMETLSSDFASLKAQNMDISSNRLKAVDDLRLEYKEMKDSQDRYGKRTRNLEEDARDYKKRMKYLEDNVENLWDHIKGLEQAMVQASSKHKDEMADLRKGINAAARLEAQKTSPLALASFQDSIKKDLKKLEDDFATKHTKLEQTTTQQGTQLTAMVERTEKVWKDLEAYDERIDDLNTSSNKLKDRVGHCETQISGLNAVSGQVKELEERLKNTTIGAHGEQSTQATNDSAEIPPYDLESHEMSITALQQRLRWFNDDQLREFSENFKKYKDLNLHVEDLSVNVETMQRKMDELKATVDERPNRIGPLENRVVEISGELGTLKHLVKELDKKKLHDISLKLSDVHTRLSTQKQSVSSHTVNANMNGQNGIPPQPNQQQDTEAVRRLDANVANMHQCIQTLIPRVDALHSRMPAVDTLGPRISRAEHNMETWAAGITALDGRMSNLTTDEMVKKMVDQGLPIWRSHFPAAANFQAEVERNRGEVNGINKTLQHIGQSLSAKATIDMVANKFELTTAKLEEVARNVSRIELETKSSNTELKGEFKSALTRISAAERDLGFIEPRIDVIEEKLPQVEEKVTDVDAKIDAQLDQTIMTQRNMERVNKALPRPRELCWATKLDHSLLPQ